MPKTCLIVDDNAETVDIVQYILKKADYEALSAGNGEEGLALARKALPDVILLDLMMPVMDGLTMNQHLKEGSTTRNIPVIIITARSSMEPMFETGKGCPIQGYLVKPFSRQELLGTIEAALKTRPA